MEKPPCIGYNGALEMKRSSQIVDHTADIGILAYGEDIEELFANAALALFSLITDAESIEERLNLSLEVSSEDTENLLVDWLNELIYLFDVEHTVFSRFEIRSLTHNHLQAVCYGESRDPTRHKIEVGVKAATYHMLKLDRNGEGYRARVILDI